jgi:hypothetical protein
MAVLVESSFLGFLSVVLFFCDLGFFVLPMYGGFLLGFSDQSSLLRCGYSGFFITAGALLLQNRGWVSTRVLGPFQQGVSTVGTSVSLLAWLIYGSPLYWSEEASFYYRAGHFMAMLALYWVLGIASGNSGVCNSTTVYCVLWAMNVLLYGLPGGPVTIFAACALVYKSSVFLHSKPHFAAAILGVPSSSA